MEKWSAATLSVFTRRRSSSKAIATCSRWSGSSDQGQKHSLLNVTYPRLKRANITTTFYSIAGDSVTHSRGTRQFLKSALENIDMLREEIEASRGKMRLILHADDLPTAPTPDELSVVMSFEGGRPLEGRIENLRNFYCLGLALDADHLELAQRARPTASRKSAPAAG